MSPASRRRLIIAAEVLLVVLLVAVNVALWTRSDPGAGGTPAASADAGGPAPAPAATDTAGVQPAGALDPATQAAVGRAGRIMVVVDTSSSMQSHLPAVAAGVKSLLGGAQADTKMGVVTYSPGGVAVVREAVDLDDAGKGQISKTMDSLKVTPGQQRPLYDALMLAFQRATDNATTSQAPIVLLVTDAGRSGGSDLGTYQTFAGVSNAKGARPAQVVLIGTGATADMNELGRAADATQGVALGAPDDAQLKTQMTTFGGRLKTKG